MKSQIILISLLCLGWLNGLVIKPPRESHIIGNSAYPTEYIDTKYVELYFVVDKALYTALGSNDAVMVKCKELATAINTIYSQINVHMVLAGVEIWSNANKISITSDSSTVLKNFQTYAASNILNVDSIHLLTTQQFSGNVVGLAYLGNMCRSGYSGSICTYSPSRPFTDIVATLAHEIGHTLNMLHDDEIATTCQCDNSGGSCIMSSYLAFVPQTMFSHCSVNAMYNYLKSPNGNCMSNTPRVQAFVDEKCGNNVLDQGEECDCGTPQYCLNTCCDASTCKLKPAAECYTGLCCKNCKLAARNTLCRPAEHDCDVADYCDGASSHCENFVVENGNSCTNEGACLDGRCKSRDLQCQWLWGGNAHNAIINCYVFLNGYGTGYGNCGFNSATNSYIPCTTANSQCGKLHCDNVQSTYPVIGFSKYSTKLGVRKNGVTVPCDGGTADLGFDQPDPGMVWDGTPCGINKYCYGHQCIEKTFVSNCKGTCGANQVCTDKGVCKCASSSTKDNCDPSSLMGGANPSVTTTMKPSVATTAKPSVATTVKPSVVTTANPQVTTTIKPTVVTTANPQVTTTVKPSLVTNPTDPSISTLQTPTGTPYVNGTANTTSITNSANSSAISLIYVLLICIIIVVLY